MKIANRRLAALALACLALGLLLTDMTRALWPCDAIADGGTTAANGSTIGYWQFDDGTIGDPAGTLVSELNSPALDGTAGDYNASGSIPVYDVSTPGLQIADGVGGTIFNSSNTSSLEFDRTDAGTTTNSNNGGSITVADPGGVDSILKPTSFTVEAFVRLGEQSDWANIVSKTKSGGTSWMMDVNSNGTLRARFDNATTSNQNFATSAFLRDGEWHHVAMTFDGSTNAIGLYMDYSQVGSATLSGSLEYSDSPLMMGAGGGGRAYDGLLDEVRLSDTVLTTDQFLVVVPEPSTLALALLGLLSLAVYRFYLVPKSRLGSEFK